VNAKEYGMTRDQLYCKLHENNIVGRRYFYPLISTFSTYCGLESSDPNNLPVATRMADTVICLPMHHELSDEEVERIISIIRK
jgi:dTDP-4-amino-4,6-dideoxygalactose transaminase